jgi:hypothetical protein
MLNFFPLPRLVTAQASPATAPNSGQVAKHQLARRIQSYWIEEA